MKAKAIVFDIDDTLYDFRACHAVAIDCVRRHVLETGLCSDIEKWNAAYENAFRWQFKVHGHSAVCHDRGIRFQRVLEALKLPITRAAALETLYWESLIARIEPFDGTVEAFDDLKAKGLTVGLGTNMTAYWQLRKIEKIGIAPLVDFAVTSEEAAAEKPDPAFFALVAEKCGCSPGETVFVGDDRCRDAEGAAKCGFVGVWLERDADKRAAFPGVPSVASIRDIGLLPYFNQPGKEDRNK